MPSPIAAAPKRVLLAVGAVALLAGCGSTVSLSGLGGQQAAGDLSGLGVPSTTTAGADQPGAVTPTDGATAAASSTTGPDGTSSIDGSYSSDTGGGGPIGSITSPTKTSSVRIGFEVLSGGTEAVSSAFGVNDNFGDAELQVNALVKYVNAHGGLGGRQIVPVFGRVSATSGESGREAACTQMTQDGKAVIVVAELNISTTEVQCAAKAHVPLVNISLGAGDKQLYKEFPGTLYSSARLDLDRELALVIDTEQAAGRISAKTRVGVMIDGTDPMYERVYTNTVDPLLKQDGIPHESFTAGGTSDVPNAVLRFRADGVKTVMFIAPSGIGEVLFLDGAQQQGYHPKYAYGDSADAYFSDDIAPKAQIVNITGAGSLPLANIHTSTMAPTSREQLCLSIMRSAGEDDTNRRSSLSAEPYCEGVFTLVAVAKHVTGVLNGASFRSAYASVGKSYQPVTTFNTDFANGLRDNVTTYRPFAYKASCTCIAYDGPVTAIP
jgi:hypothetical protein